MLVIPENPTTAGQLHVTLDLSTEEWKGINSRLVQVLLRLSSQNGGATAETPRPSTAGSATSEARPTQHQQHDFTPSIAPLPLPVASTRGPKHPAPTQAQSTSSGREWSQYTASSAAQPALPPALRPTQKSPILPAALQAVLSSSAGTSPIKPSITPQALGAHGPPGGQSGQPKAPAERSPRAPSPWPEQVSQQLWSTARAQARQPALLEVGTWSTVWSTDELDNDGASISGMVHMPGIPGLPGGDGHAGYLITAASQLLTLYECSASGGRGEASLQIMHQLSTDTQTCALAADVSNLLLLASAQDPGKPTRCLAVHSVSPEAGLFEPKGRAPLPPIGSPTPSTAAINLFTPQVASLHGLGGPLAGCCAVSYGRSLAVYSSSIAPGDIPKPKAHWQAHGTPVTSLHCSEHGMQLWSGAQDGTVHAWDMRHKPLQPAVQIRQSGPVRSLGLVTEHCLQSGSGDSVLSLWDVRNPTQPLRSLHTPDSGGITAAALGPFGDTLVMGTDRGGVFAVNIGDQSYSVTDCASLEDQVSHVCWNMGSGEVYAAMAARVVVLRQL